MATRDISFSLRRGPIDTRQIFTIPLTNSQFIGIQAFIGLYNPQGIIHEEDFEGEEELQANLPIFILGQGFPEDLEVWETDDTGEDHNISMTAVIERQKITYRDWNRETLQGFITIAGWLGVNWHDYVSNITIDGQPAQVD